MIEFSCPSCSSPIKAPDGTEGLKMNCYDCGELAEIPRSSLPATSPGIAEKSNLVDSQKFATFEHESESPGNVGSSVIGQSEVLLKAARPDIYRVNAFRVADLPVDATGREISRQLDKIKILERFGGQSARTSHALALKPAPDANLIREAIERLRDPESRLVDEFLWFWPYEFGTSKSDMALAALSNGEIQSAAQQWLNGEREQSYADVAKHNLAIVAHVKALDLEYKVNNNGQALPKEKTRRRDYYWGHAFARWRVLMADDAFWDRLANRIRDLNEPQLTQGTARRMRSSLPVALLYINAQLAVGAAEKGNTQEASRHVKIIRKSGFDPYAIDEALRKAVAPLRERVRLLSKTAECDADAQPEKAHKVAKRLLQQARPLLKIIECLLPEGNATREVGHDEVALRLLVCQVVYSNKTKDWQGSLELLQAALACAASASARARIEENIGIVKNNLEYGNCWFCRTQPGDEKSSVQLKMHGNIRREPTFGGYRLLWSYATIKVPRCKNCKAHHEIMPISVASGFVGGLALGIGGCIMAMPKGAGPDKGNIGGTPIVLFLIFTIIGLVLGIVVGLLRRPEGPKPKPENQSREFSTVKELLAQGWAFGEKPPGA